MIPIPKGKPAIGTLNTYYLRLDRLIEHCQGEVGAGCIHLHCPEFTAAVYFDPDEVVQTCYETPKGIDYAERAFSRLLDGARQRSCPVDVFSLDPARVHFWASLARSERLYSDLSAEFTDLRGLVKKMGKERLTGFIDVSMPEKASGALLVFDEGQIVDGSYPLEPGQTGQQGSLEDLIDRCTTGGAIFTVCRAVLPGPPVRSAPEVTVSDGGRLIQAAELVLQALETEVRVRKNLPTAFSTLLRAKFLGKAGKYEFLDPFAGEFGYEDGKIQYQGGTDFRTVAVAVGECVAELATELKLGTALQQRLQREFSQRPQDLEALGLAA